MSSVQLSIGDIAPDFTLPDVNERPVSLSSFRGKNVIVYFYPAAGTPGCTVQACDFRDNLSSLSGANFVVLGVSQDSPETLKKFGDDENLTFPLLSDSDLSVHKSYGAWGQKTMYGRTVTGVIRSTFVVDEQGKLRDTFYNVRATGHVVSLRKKLGLDT